VTTKLINQNEFLRLLLRSEREILRYVMTIVPNTADAQEIMQEAAVALWQQVDKYDPSQPFVAWACSFAANKAREFRRKNHRWKGFLDEELASQLVKRRAEMTPELDRRVDFLRECLLGLPARQREIVEKYYFEQASIDAVSQAAGRSADAVYKALQRIRSQLMDCVSGKLMAREGRG